MAQGPVFLERQSYRLRRMRDAVLLLPFLGLLLWMAPLLWPLPQEGAEQAKEVVPMSTALRYLFGTWVGMVVLGWALWHRTAGKLNKANPLQADDTN